MRCQARRWPVPSTGSNRRWIYLASSLPSPKKKVLPECMSKGNAYKSGTGRGKGGNGGDPLSPQYDRKDIFDELHVVRIRSCTDYGRIHRVTGADAYGRV